MNGKIHDVYALPVIEPDLRVTVELAAVFCGALSGGLAAVRRHFDIFGVLVLAWATGLGGGLLRDIILGDTPPIGVSDWRLVATAVAAGLIIFFFHPRIEAMYRVIIVLDAWALALFVLNGTLKALDFESGSLVAIIAGVLTGVGGGVLRDVLTGEVPLILQDRQLYAIPALAGAALTALAWNCGAIGWVVQSTLVCLVVGFRLLSLRKGWSAPTPPRRA